MTQLTPEAPVHAGRAARIEPAQAAALVIVSLAALSYFLWYIVSFRAYPADDAFIHMRSARNFLSTGAPYFNPSEAVAATSSPLWVVVLTSSFAVAGASPGVVAFLVGLFTIGLYLALTTVLSEDLGALPAALMATLIIAVTTLATAAQLMESTLALLFWCLSLISVRKQQAVRAGVLAGLAFCTRYEMVLWLALAMLVLPGWRAKHRYVLGASGPLAALSLFNFGYFGSFVPNTVRAKSIIYQMSIADAIGTLRLGYNVVAFGSVLALLVLLIGCFLRDRERRPVAAVLAFGALLMGLYVVRQTFVFPWYRPLYLLPLFTGCVLALAMRGWPQQLLAALLIGMIGALPIAISVRETVGLGTGRHELYSEYGPGLRVNRYLQIGADLQARYPQASLLTSEVGGLGWSFEGRIIDGVGLISPEMLRFHPMSVPADRANGGLGALPPQAVVLARPDLIVSMDIFSMALRRDIASGAITGYSLDARYPALAPAAEQPLPDFRLWGAQETLVYVRDAAP